MEEKLLREIEKKEFARLDALTFEELEQEVKEWFNEECNINTSKQADREVCFLLNDFMEYRRKESGADLLEVIKRYEKI